MKARPRQFSDLKQRLALRRVSVLLLFRRRTLGSEQGVEALRGVIGGDVTFVLLTLA